MTPQQSQLESQESLVQAQLVDESDQLSHSSSSRKQKIKQVINKTFLFISMSALIRFIYSPFQYVKREVAKFFGVDVASEERERVKWSERQKRLALRRFGSLKQVGLICRNISQRICFHKLNLFVGRLTLMIDEIVNNNRPIARIYFL